MQDIGTSAQDPRTPKRFLSNAARTVRRLCLLALLPVLLATVPAAASDLADTPENRLHAAKLYLQTVPTEAMVVDMTEEFLKLLPPEQHETFRIVMEETMAKLDIEKITTKAMVKHFTVDEIFALTAFYKTPEGQSVMKKMSKFDQEIIPEIMRVMPEILKAVEERMSQ